MNKSKKKNLESPEEVVTEWKETNQSLRSRIILVNADLLVYMGEGNKDLYFINTVE